MSRRAARIAYEAAEAVSAVRHNLRKIPWEAVHEDTKDAFEAAASAVLDDFVNSFNECPPTVRAPDNYPDGKL